MFSVQLSRDVQSSSPLHCNSVITYSVGSPLCKWLGHGPECSGDARVRFGSAAEIPVYRAKVSLEQLTALVCQDGFS